VQPEKREKVPFLGGGGERAIGPKGRGKKWGGGKGVVPAMEDNLKEPEKKTRAPGPKRGEPTGGRANARKEEKPHSKSVRDDREKKKKKKGLQFLMRSA